MCKAISTHFLRTSAEKGGADVCIEEGSERSHQRQRWLLLNQEEKELAVRPVLPCHIPLHGRCAQTPTIPWIQGGPNAPPRSASPTNFERSQRWPLGIAPSTRFPGQRPSSTNFQHTSELYPVPRSDLRSALPTNLIVFYFSRRCCLYDLDRSVTLPRP